MSSVMSYGMLTKIVNDNLRKNGLDELVFESPENLKYTIYNYPLSRLLNIVDSRQFLYESYYKILDRKIDGVALEHLVTRLQDEVCTKTDIINMLLNSEECKLKKTKIDVNA